MKKYNGEDWMVTTVVLYDEDVELLDKLVKEAKSLGNRRANRSWIIRHAIRLVDVKKALVERK